ncbi:helix-turn-helix domain-containing protein [Armatimonas sp.]|uniref:helix-turn-helix domain-containing protein n=1 Tax=Armatimonas sp. TaxID=1872638 RepID=UPI00375311D9
MSPRTILATPEEQAQGKRFADWLRLERAKRNLTKAELSRRSGVSTSYLTLIETGGIKTDGKYQLPGEEILTKLAVTLELDPEILLAVAGHDKPELQYVPDIDTLLGRMEGFNDFDGPSRELIREAALVAAKNMAETLRKLDSRSIIGSRFSYEEIEDAEEEQARIAETAEIYVTDEMVTPREPEPKRRRRVYGSGR